MRVLDSLASRNGFSDCRHVWVVFNLNLTFEFIERNHRIVSLVAYLHPYDPGIVNIPPCNTFTLHSSEDCVEQEKIIGVVRDTNPRWNALANTFGKRV